MPFFGAGIGISSLNVESTNFRKARPILVISSSNDAAPKRNSDLRVKVLKFDFRELLINSSPKGVFQSKYSIA
jgi:hypothetical protein